jgi:hypothetical protein
MHGCSTGVILLALPLCLLISLKSRNKQTFGRWWRKDGKAYFVTGIPDSMGSAFKQPVLELYSWKLFVENGQEVRLS